MQSIEKNAQVVSRANNLVAYQVSVRGSLKNS